MEATLTAEKYYVGLTHTYTQVIDDKLVRAFAELSGDRNPIHLDDAIAGKSKFGRRIAHGAILFGIVSKVLGMDMPGVGTVYLSQLCNFKLPVFIGDTVTLEAKIVEILPKSIARISTIITKQTGEVVMDGEAQVKLPGWLFKS
ncbi:MAG TPA: MaoC family dehydratase [candidate division Zixibacteria bacterium]|nr:MaoC family dehydratase [candidate division Zixibacteria bacterium]